MEEKILNEEASLELISQMIRNTRRKLEDGNGISFLVWGYTTFVISLAVYFFIKTTGDYHYNFLWFLTPVLGSIGMSIFKRNKTKHGGHAMNFIDRTIRNIWMVIGIAAFLTSVGASFARFPILSVMLLLLGIGTALTGLTIKFKLVVISGFIGMLSCVVPFFINGYEQILVFGVICLIMMVIPGHILNYQGRKKHV
jgi:hypothetical protein